MEILGWYSWVTYHRRWLANIGERIVLEDELEFLRDGRRTRRALAVRLRALQWQRGWKKVWDRSGAKRGAVRGAASRVLLIANQTSASWVFAGQHFWRIPLNTDGKSGLTESSRNGGDSWTITITIMITITITITTTITTTIAVCSGFGVEMIYWRQERSVSASQQTKFTPAIKPGA